MAPVIPRHCQVCRERYIPSAVCPEHVRKQHHGHSLCPGSRHTPVHTAPVVLSLPRVLILPRSQYCPLPPLPCPGLDSSSWAASISHTVEPVTFCQPPHLTSLPGAIPSRKPSCSVHEPCRLPRQPVSPSSAQPQSLTRVSHHGLSRMLRVLMCFPRPTTATCRLNTKVLVTSCNFQVVHLCVISPSVASRGFRATRWQKQGPQSPGGSGHSLGDSLEVPLL